MRHPAMDFALAQAQMPWWHALIAWTYLATNAARVFTYVPQVVVVWRCRDGARAISLLTWSSWSVSHLAAVLYGALVAHDHFLVGVSLINLLGCGLVTGIAMRRRRGELTSQIGPQRPSHLGNELSKQ